MEQADRGPQAEQPEAIHWTERLSGQSKGIQWHEAKGARAQPVPGLLLSVGQGDQSPPCRAGDRGEFRDGGRCQPCGAVAMIRNLDFILG